MRIIISPAKKMRSDTDSLPWLGLPVFLNKTEQLLDNLRGKTPQELKNLWKCNDAIAELNIRRLQDMDLRSQLTPAVLAYEGIQYQYMAPGVFSDREFNYIEEHLRILSGFYGILKPFDGVTPYRLEMQTKLKIGDCSDLYGYWGDLPANRLFSETDFILNLASKEYSTCVSRYLPGNIRFLTCVFGEEQNGKVIEKGTMCKMARGEMVRFLAENQICQPDQIKSFNRLGYCFSEAHSSSEKFVFIKDATGG